MYRQHENQETLHDWLESNYVAPVFSAPPTDKNHMKSQSLVALTNHKCQDKFESDRPRYGLPQGSLREEAEYFIVTITLLFIYY